MKTVMSHFKIAGLVLAIVCVLGLLVADQIRIHQSWLTVKPSSNAAKVYNFFIDELSDLKETGGDTSKEVSFSDVQEFLLDDLIAVRNQNASLPDDAPAYNWIDEQDALLYGDTVLYVEGTYEAFCVVTYNVTDNEENKNVIMRSSDDYAMTSLEPRGACTEGILDRAEEFGVEIGSEGGIAVA